jgi:hypothetical protein
MRIPEFSAEASLGKSRGHYQAQISVGSVSRGFVPALSTTGCFCTEPDIKRVCTSSGYCYNQKVCLQWFCPSRGGATVDDDDFGGLFGLTPQ